MYIPHKPATFQHLEMSQNQLSTVMYEVKNGISDCCWSRHLSISQLVATLTMHATHTDSLNRFVNG